MLTYLLLFVYLFYFLVKKEILIKSGKEARKLKTRCDLCCRRMTSI